MDKTCVRCGESKPASRDFFGSTPSGGLRGYCRTCMNKASREYESRNKAGRRTRDAKRARAGDGTRAAFDDATKRDLYRRQSGLCPCCGKPIESAPSGEVDHMVPLARGGAHHPKNFILAHRKCNKEKHNKTLVEHWDWRVKVGLDDENLGRRLGLLSK